MICYIGVGSNLGNRSGYIRKAIALLKEINDIKIRKISPVYETKPVGGPSGQGKFLNLALKVKTSLTPETLLSVLKKIETETGRHRRKMRWAAREIDLDILLCGRVIVDKKDLCIPHPRMQERFFVLKPLSDIAPEVVHPVFRKKISTLLSLLEGAR